MSALKEKKKILHEMKPHWDIETLISVDDIIFDPTTATEFQNDIGHAWRFIFDFRHVKKKETMGDRWVHPKCTLTITYCFTSSKTLTVVRLDVRYFLLEMNYL